MNTKYGKIQDINSGDIQWYDGDIKQENEMNSLGFYKVEEYGYPYYFSNPEGKHFVKEYIFEDNHIIGHWVCVWDDEKKNKK